MGGPRHERLAEHLQQEIATIIHRELKDPRLGFVTVTRVELSKDLSHAKVFFSCLGGNEERERSHQALTHCTGYIHGLIKKRFRMKIIPEIQFKYDESIARSIALEQTIEQLEKTEES